MASKPEKRVASSVFITLAPPPRDAAVVEEVRRAACAARPGRLWESPAPTKAPGAGLAERPGPWTPSGRAAATVPAAPTQLSNGGGPLPPPALDGEDVLPDLDLLPPPPPPPAYLPPPSNEDDDDAVPAPMGASLISDLEQLHLPPPPPPPPQPLAEGPPFQLQPSCLGPMEEELPPPPDEPVGFPEREASTDVCAFCHKTVSPRELAVEAMRRQYHAQCFTCRTCRRQLAGQSFYQKDGRPLCEPCYQDTLEKCGKCGEVVREHIIRALGRAFHPTCFTCVTCARCIGDESFALDSQNEVYCLDDFYRKFAPVCSICENPIIPRDGKDAFKIECMGRNFHENCYRCEDCRILLSVEPTDQGCYPLNDRLFCKPCHVKRSAAGCC
ncbi:filamin-binding LIM protein 1 [Sturnira hondurensis]|uniref:filamin-binding LIM protein 1 n=1 Tax=Sturnira hondurensis TaxID=192404 RepID=UPI00187A4A05|nr:filamin-binding LIM protein 1 [Sturnira hondurensis]XP_036901042.1 filamin-binding LIM protein 1 [Sturnira hondurensis]XP_036901043.1 filamin-binding LIM protein 1 [Sturnira hondurensis]XP_036901044.1 filamin-binding LIM protein 1 [Sturnira hondurensis]